jgi:hypothetical protein
VRYSSPRIRVTIAVFIGNQVCPLLRLERKNTD